MITITFCPSIYRPIHIRSTCCNVLCTSFHAHKVPVSLLLHQSPQLVTVQSSESVPGATLTERHLAQVPPWKSRGVRGCTSLKAMFEKQKSSKFVARIRSVILTTSICSRSAYGPCPMLRPITVSADPDDPQVTPANDRDRHAGCGLRVKGHQTRAGPGASMPTPATRGLSVVYRASRRSKICHLLRCHFTFQIYHL